MRGLIDDHGESEKDEAEDESSATQRQGLHADSPIAVLRRQVGSRPESTQQKHHPNGGVQQVEALLRQSELRSDFFVQEQSIVEREKDVQ